ncbi:MAG: FAD-dependent oxidoreductase [Alphaproteobacteria bacterium]|nr:FAD-dependent oxidoreductase [Alphaproteobacteria bacterium]
MRQLRQTMALAHMAHFTGTSVDEARERVRAFRSQRREAIERKNARSAEATRRGFLQGVGALGLVGLAGTSSRAWALRQSDARIAVIGAGIGGLSCADFLASKGFPCDVFDAAERVGGRMHSLGGAFPGPIALGNQVTELGGEFIDTSHTMMKAYAREFGFEMEDVLAIEEGDPIFYLSGQYYTEDDIIEDYRDFVAAMKADLRILGGPTADAFTPEDEILDYTSLEEYLVTRGASPMLTDLIRETYRNEYGRDIDQQSCLNFLYLIHADRSSNWRPWGVFSDERYHVIGGNQQIPVAIANRLPNGVELGHRLVAARRLATGTYRLTFSVAGGPTVDRDYDYVVFATPFSTLRNVALDASLGLPSWKHYAIDELQYGTNAKMILAFDGRPWHDAGSSGNMVTYGDPDLNSGWESNPSLATDTSAVYIDYSGGARGANLDPNDPAGEATRWLAAFDRIVPGASAAIRRDTNGAPVATIRHWPSDPNHLGAYTCNQPGYFTTICDNEGKRVDNLLFAGEHANSFYEFQGWMEGGALSGAAAGKAIWQD